jgi:hypothetical protein
VSAFVGAALGVEAHRGSFIGQATFDGVISVMLHPRELVAALLPVELRPADAASATPELHPVVLLFGNQRAGSILMAGVPVALGISYHEFMLAVPCVRHVRGVQLHTFSAIMHTDHAPARWSGNSYYGYAKHMADMGWSGESFIVSEPEGAVIAHARIEAVDQWVAAEEPAAAALQTIRGYFELPILGRKDDGTYVASHFEWRFDHAAVRPVDASLSFERGLAGLPPGVYADTASGSIQVKGMRWRVSWPFAPRLQRRTEETR